MYVYHSFCRFCMFKYIERMCLLYKKSDSRAISHATSVGFHFLFIPQTYAFSTALSAGSSPLNTTFKRIGVISVVTITTRMIGANRSSLISPT